MSSQPNNRLSPEPADDDARLGHLLRAHSADYLDDAGFTGRVLAALPRAPRRFEARRRALVAGAAALGTAVALSAAGPATWLDFGMRLGGLFAQWGARLVPGLGEETSLGAVVLAMLAGAAAWWVWIRRAERP